MQIKNIHSMKWGSADHTVVCFIADTNSGNNQEIATPYNETSIVWEAVSAFPVDQIAEYTPSEEEPV